MQKVWVKGRFWHVSFLSFFCERKLNLKKGKHPKKDLTCKQHISVALECVIYSIRLQLKSSDGVSVQQLSRLL